MSVSAEEVRVHDKSDDCWIAIHGQVYDVTRFLLSHPGGAKIILKLAGKDGTVQFDKFHGVDILQPYLYEKVITKVGALACTGAGATAGAAAQAAAQAAQAAEAQHEESIINRCEPERMFLLKHKPALEQVMNLYDFEYIANKTLEPIARNYYSSGVDDEVTTRENHFAYKRIFFNPRVLIDVTECDISCELLGSPSSAPFYVSATAMQKYAHQEGEKVFSRGCGKESILQMIPCLSSYPFGEIVQEIKKNTPFWYQLYLSQHDGLNEQIVRKVEAAGCRGIFITVDNVYGGNREKDRRTKVMIDRVLEAAEQTGGAAGSDSDSLILISASRKEGDGLGSSKQTLGRRAVTWLTWPKMRHLKSITSMPFVVKGVQSVQDVQLAVDNGMDGVVLSNHGGRQVDFSKSTIEVLFDVHKQGLHKKIDIFVDGGVRRGTDIIKALCLGAKAVGLGRGLLYPVATYGEEGLVSAIRLLKEEMVATMRNIGVRNLAELNESYIDTDNIKNRCSNFADQKDLFNRATLPSLFPSFDKVKL